VDERAVLNPGTVLSDGARVDGGVCLWQTVVLEGAHVERDASDVIVMQDGTYVPGGEPH
jgi:hypothetical protein